ncbi:YdcF family protein [Atopomonas sediminilitoris]|uniref:YdcF family protein n=1 Tax=Atopomonas sediminilitoris TaxID=2919919 RepID=UPI001F4D8C74|nr:YdcF family protein [Atopomonas sediminilitoris]MCJ8170666.1 YdcF family protein [Atopomonas sediminilitoris]
MELRYLLKMFLLPPGGLLLGLLLAWLLRSRWPRLANAVFAVSLLGLLAMAAPAVVQWQAQLLEREPALDWQSDWAKQAQTIVVLGGGRERADPGWGGDVPSLYAAERLHYAARLAKASGLPVLASGGLHFGQPPSEAALAGEMLADFGVPLRWQEEQSRTTWENAVYSAPLLKAEGIKRVVLVTQAWHMPRARWCFEQQGFEVISAPMGFMSAAHGRPGGGWAPEGKALWQSQALFNEWVGLLLYPWLYAEASSALVTR